MKKHIISLGILFSFFASAANAENITQFIIEKKVDIDRKTGFILSSDLKPLQKLKPRRATVYSSKTNKVSLDSFKKSERIYSIVTDNDSYNSVISVKDTDGNELKAISVGRGAFKIIESSKNGHLFVLCGGYFGSVWEIDPEINIVVRKFSTSWNPTDFSLDTAEKYLYVTSGKLQKFSLESGIVVEIDLPSEIRYLSSVNSVNISTMVFGGFTKENSSVVYKLSSLSNKLFPADDLTSSFSESKEKTVNSNLIPIGSNEDIILIYSKNNDFIYLFSQSLGTIQGIIALDAKPDEVLIAPKLNKALILHRVIGQISLIDLTPESSTQYSVIARIMDDRLKDSTNAFVIEGNKVYIKSDSAQEGYIDSDNILRFTSPIVEVPFNKEKEIFKIATLANKRFYLKSNQLFFEDLSDSGLNYSRKIRLTTFGNNIGGIDISEDSKILYFSDYSQNMVFAIDTFTNKVLRKFVTGTEPTDVVVNKNSLYVLNRGVQTISTIDLSTFQTVNVNRLKVENNNLSVIKIYDKDFDQIIKVTLTLDVNKELSMLKIEDQN